jgi:hypothetical protein
MFGCDCGADMGVLSSGIKGRLSGLDGRVMNVWWF